MGGAIVIGIARDADLTGAFDERLAERMRVVEVGNSEIAIAAAERFICLTDPLLAAPC